MDEFLQSIKDNLDNRPEPDFEEAAWKDLEQKLEQKETRPALMAWGLWPLFALLFLSLIGNIWWGANELLGDEEKLTHTVFRDTVYQTRVIYKTDTIYKAGDLAQIEGAANAKNNQKGNYALPFHTKANLFGLSNAGFVAFNEATSNFKSFHPEMGAQASGQLRGFYSDSLSDDFKGNLNNSALAAFVANAPVWLNQQRLVAEKEENAKTEEQKKAVLETELVSFVPLDYLGRLNPDDLEAPPYGLLDIDPINITQRTSSSFSLGDMLRPSGFQMGISGGGGFLFGQQVEEGSATALSLDAVIEFTPNWQLWGEGTYQNLKYKVSVLDAAFDVPPIEPPMEDANFKYGDIKMPTLQYALGMQYLTRLRYLGNSSVKWRWLLGAGYAAVQTLPYEIYYEYELPDGGESQIEEYVNTRELLSNFAVVRTGLDFRLNQHFFPHIRAAYSTPVGQQNLMLPQFLKMEAGLKYKF